MSISAMVVNTVKNPSMNKQLKYNSKLWTGNIDISDLLFNDFSDLHKYLKRKYSKIYFFRIELAKTFGNQIVKPKDLYMDDMDDENTHPNCIMVAEHGSLKLIVVKARRAKEFVAFNSAAKNVYVPVFMYKDSQKKVNLINFK